MNKQKQLGQRRQRRRYSVRNRMQASAERPRLCVHRSLQNIAAQLIDDETGRTIVSVSSRDKSVRDEVGYGGNCDAAAKIGKLLAEKAASAGIKRVTFDRGHNKYHGRIAALADAAREGGLEF